MMIQTYADFAPTAMDPRGLALDTQQHWLVCPVSRNRDSGIRAEANWQSQGEILDSAGIAYETHRFGHWACGWFEIMICEPSDAAVSELESIAGCLSENAVLDDSLYSRLETDAIWDYFSREGAREFVSALQTEFELSSDTHDWLVMHASENELYALMVKYSGYPCDVDDVARCIEHASQSTRLGRSELAAWIAGLRTGERRKNRMRYELHSAGWTTPIKLGRSEALAYLAGRRDKDRSVASLSGVVRSYAISMYGRQHTLTVTLVSRAKGRC